jgi:formylglycine-generating enzyme required for sulfatase activity
LQITNTSQGLVDTAAAGTAKFYRALVLNPSNMVFVAPNTFTQGSPTNEQERSLDEPEMTVTLTRGYWIGKFLVTQAEYQDLIGVNPSDFKGDSNRPVESVSWGQASNYCVQLTQRELTAGRIPPGAHYRLPTEAEWECAARAGTTTRFYYGDDPTAAQLAAHAWYGALNGITTHPVGQKLPNAWGLYDMEGNVLEWCQDWYTPYPGGAVTDPQGGPASIPQGYKVTRGGAWDAFESDCRSARRQFQGAPFNTDDTIGFRVVLVIDP